MSELRQLHAEQEFKTYRSTSKRTEDQYRSIVEQHEQVSFAAAAQIRLLQRLLREARLEIARLRAAQDK